MTRWGTWLAELAAVCVLGFACWRAVEPAWTESPHDARFLLQQAEHAERQGGDPAPLLRRAVAVKPDDAGIHIRLGLLAESRRDFTAAERHLLEAARRSRKYEPRWTLANYYFRRGAMDPFWHWSREAFRMSWGDRTALLDLCWRASGDAETLLRRAIPEQRELRAAAAWFLMSRGQWQAVEPLALELATEATPVESTMYLAACDGLLESSRTAAAVALWNTLNRRGLFLHTALDPGGGRIVSNPDFTAEGPGRCFDWRIPSPHGISVSPLRPPGEGWRITLNGRQPERCELLYQVLPVEPGKRYRFSCSYQFEPLATAAGRPVGLRWRVDSHPAAARPLAESTDLANSAGNPSWEFVATSGQARLALVYERPTGVARLDGWILLRSMRAGLVQ